MFCFTRCSCAAYNLTDDYANEDFFSAFTFFNEPDPTEGHVEYVSKQVAHKNLLAGTLVNHDNAVYLGVDAQHIAETGRQSVRLTSKKSFNKGLFIADIAHAPNTICGVWPAFWMLSSSAVWPVGGEIDILEGVNDQVGNHMTLHTSEGCSIGNASTSSPAENFTGQLGTTNCDVKAPDQPTNAGCQISNPDPAAFGTGFNKVGGGVYAMEWTSASISIWHFPRASIPSDLSSNATNPDPSKWPTPVARFNNNSEDGSKCDIDARFKDLQIVFDTTFCGAWAGNEDVWSKSGCVALAPTCKEYVAQNPEAFTDAYWTINSVRVYEQEN